MTKGSIGRDLIKSILDGKLNYDHRAIKLSEEDIIRPRQAHYKMISPSTRKATRMIESFGARISWIRFAKTIPDWHLAQPCGQSGQI
eukprot:7925767-Pyramimonas_sp.AAC.1